MSGDYLDQLKKIKNDTGGILTKPTEAPFVSFVGTAHAKNTKISGFTLDELRQAAGDDWHMLEADPDTLAGFAHALQNRHMRERGEVPLHYTAITECAMCGPVTIFAGAPSRVLSCPWCFVRIRGGTVPRPVSPERRVVGRTVGGIQVIVERDNA